MSRRRVRAVSATLSAVLLYLSAAAPPARAAYDLPLTVQMIKDDWRMNPTLNPQRYIENTVKERGVGFLPTKEVREELKNYGVPAVVIDSLRLYTREADKFKIQVWDFGAEAGTLSGPALKDLAHRIVNELTGRTSELGAVFPHFKPPLPETCDPCPETTEPRLHMKGRVTKEGNRLKVTFWTTYKSASQDQKVGPDSVVYFRSSGDGLQEAASQIVTEFHGNLKNQITGR